MRTRELEGIAGHATSVLPLSQELLAEAGYTKTDLSAVAFGQGPGAFTGIRVACGVAISQTRASMWSWPKMRAT